MRTFLNKNLIAVSILLLSFALAQAEDMVINDIQTEVVPSADSLHQAAFLLTSNMPSQFDSTTEIAFAQLAIGIDFQPVDIFPVALGCAPIQVGQDLGELTFESFGEDISDVVYPEYMVTFSSVDTLSDTAYFDITNCVKAALAGEINPVGLAIFPLESQSYINGLSSEQPYLELKISYSIREDE